MQISGGKFVITGGASLIGSHVGVTMVDAALNAAGEAEYGAVYRTARRLFEGSVVVPR